MENLAKSYTGVVNKFIAETRLDRNFKFCQVSSEQGLLVLK